jgi:nucleolar GTP-binding protein
VVLFIVDPSGTSGYEVSDQLNLLRELKSLVGLPVIVAANKMDLEPTEPVNEAFGVSTISGEGIAAVLKASIDLASSAHHAPLTKQIDETA